MFKMAQELEPIKYYARELQRFLKSILEKFQMDISSIILTL